MSAVRRVKINLDRERTLVYDLAALRKFEEMTGKSSFTFWNDMRASDISAFLYVGLLREDPNITQEEADSLVDLNNIGDLTDTVTKAYFATAPEGDGEGNPDSSIG